MTSGEQGKRGPGRPRMNPQEGSRRNATIQISSALYDKVKEASESSGLSISREMEQRIEQTFRDNDLHTILLGSKRAAAAIHIISAIMRMSKTSEGKDWEDDAGVANAVGIAISNLLTQISGKAIEASDLLRVHPELDKNIKYAGQLIANYAILSYRGEFDPEILEGREDRISPSEAIERFVVRKEKI